MTGTMTFNLNINWHKYDTPLRVDVMCLVLAVALHVPFYFVKVDAKKKAKDLSKNRLGEVVMIDQIEKKEDIPVPAPIEKKMSLGDRLKALVKKEPPPPPPPKIAEPPKQLADAPKQIALAPKLDMNKKIEPKLQTKEGFQAKDAALVEKQISLKSQAPAIAPLSAKKLGTIENRSAIKESKGGFKVAESESLKTIGGGPSIADPGAPRIAIATGKSGSKEGFTAPPPQKLDKGKLAGVPGGSLDSGKMGLRDQIIARDGGGKIAPTGSRPSMGAGGGATAAKQDAGRFEGGQVGGVAGGVAGGTVGGVLGSSGSGSRIATGAPAQPKKKKEMFQLTGELKDRARLHQEVPQYPAWAEQKGIEAAVILEFSVEPTGLVKDAIVVVRTSGYPELDELAKKALRKWKFVPLDENRVEVGRITFNYTLN